MYIYIYIPSIYHHIAAAPQPLRGARPRCYPRCPPGGVPGAWDGSALSVLEGSLENMEKW